ncbi:UNVERIFIED_CONTAM: hypothetical protein Scaly_0609900 [Sesamum calycinum]|uniref:DUF4283 domain-containing protein n=1 Tax=Sesamum calycinum TaxID=2727403 RepID=A0AAW2RSM3_9LAMI
MGMRNLLLFLKIYILNGRQDSVLVLNTEDNKQVYEIRIGKEVVRGSDRREKVPMMIDAVTTMTISESLTRISGIGEPMAAFIPRHDLTTTGLFVGQPIVLKQWEPGMVLRKHKHTQVPVWIKLRYLPVEFWTNEGLSMVASGIGSPLYPDAITKSCTRLDFARVCIMLDISSKLPKHIVIMMPTEEGGETPCRVDNEYEWIPPKYRAC